MLRMSRGSSGASRSNCSEIDARLLQFDLRPRLIAFEQMNGSFQESLREQARSCK